MSRRIALTRGKFAIVDDADFEWLSQWKWYAFKDRHTYYAARSNWVDVDGKKITMFMHRLILKPPDGMGTDHINHDGLDNQRANLRAATHSQNMMNRRKGKGCSSVYKGVTWYTGSGKWRAKIKVSGRTKHLGLFTDEGVAARAYNKAARMYFGDFAHLNTVKDALEAARQARFEHGETPE